ncbi:MAG TPA: VOC family protein [Chitinophagaceae bacterium]|nr:VOC family protein [Chitinophagaceae bacterium]
MGINTITHVEIPAPDLAKAIAFYSSVFDWQIQITEPGRYAYFIIEKNKSGGGFDTSLKPAEEKCGPQVVIDVDDIDDTLQTIREKGGIVTMPKTAIAGGHGFYACFRDINKNHLQIHSMR